MKKLNLVLVLFAVVLMFFAGTSFAAEVTVGVDAEIVYANETVDSGAGNEVESAGYTTTDADIKVKVAIDDNTEAAFLVDADDNTDQLEEIHITFKNVGGAPLDIKVGKQEVAFGMDKDLGIDDPAVHAGEVDNKFGITLTSTPIQDSPKIELTLFEDNTGQGANSKSDKPADNGIAQSLAARLTSTRVPGLKAMVSYILRHEEGRGETPGECDDESAWSIGLDYTMDPINFYAEYIMANDVDHSTDINSTILSVGLAFKANDNISVVAQYHSATVTDDNTGGSTAEPNVSSFSLTPKYTMGNGVELALEYKTETADADVAGVNDVDTDTISARVKFKY